jgi:DNA-binding HxlR family transcriptional regulator
VSDLFLADCPARTTLDVVADTCAVVVVTALGERPHRHSELRKHIGGISAKVLTQTLRRLEANGLVTRRSLATAPRGVEYHLTTLGETLLVPIHAPCAWAEANTDAQIQTPSSSRQQYTHPTHSHPED